MKFKIFNFLLPITGLILFSACKKFVEIATPSTQIVTANVFNSSTSATAAQLAIYSQMVSNNESGNMSQNLGLLADELTNYVLTSPPMVQYYINAMTALNAPGPWVNAYNYIYEANAVIEGLNGNAAISGPINQQLSGEARFIRSFWYFYLVNLYGDVPMPLSTNYSINAELGRTSKVQVYNQIISDLKEAKGLLSANFVDASDTTVTTLDRTRPTKWAAAALLARTYLFTKDYADAESESDSVLNQAGLFGLYNNFDSIFLANSQEAIWQLGIPQPSSYNTLDGRQYILLAPPGNGFTCCAISPELLSSFDSSDTRQVHWVDSFQVATTPVINYYYPYKYKIASGTVESEDVMVLRLAEQYLIRSEARAQQGNVSGAVSDLNVIRQRAQLSVYSGTLDQQSLLEAILHERQIELFSEWGHRWLDLIRTNTINTVMGVVEPIKGGQWIPNGNQTLFPIPQTELTADTKLSQNAGY